MYMRTKLIDNGRHCTLAIYCIVFVCVTSLLSLQYSYFGEHEKYYFFHLQHEHMYHDVATYSACQRASRLKSEE